jgi:hypothetical protein
MLLSEWTLPRLIELPTKLALELVETWAQAIRDAAQASRAEEIDPVAVAVAQAAPNHAAFAAVAQEIVVKLADVGASTTALLEKCDSRGKDVRQALAWAENAGLIRWDRQTGLWVR